MGEIVPLRHTICLEKMLLWRGFAARLSLCMTQFEC